MTPRILAWDTATEFGSLALLEGDRTLEEVWLHSPEGFAQVLFPELERLLERHGWKLASVDLFAVAKGPGAFTGIRVGLAAAKGLAEVLHKPVCGISNLQAVASFGTAPVRAALVDARRGEIYGAVYSSSLELLSPELVMPFRAWLETLPPGEIEFVSTDFSPFRTAIENTRFAGAPAREAPRALAAAVGRIAASRWARGRLEDPATLDANYVRRSDAELFASHP